jgi:hypothetical protein
MTVKTYSMIFGIVFLLVGLLGFTSNPIISNRSDAIFHTDLLHNMVHLVSGVFFLLFATAWSAHVTSFTGIFGSVYLLLGILGFIVFGGQGEGKLLGFLHVNSADNFLHIGLGALILLASLVRRPASTYAIDGRHHSFNPEQPVGRRR